ncbi:MAG: choline-sulfatase [Planctomycetes bacterium RBG_16_64_12]|nr:MAG: choline-sulfatase [Planctomycetes bacterium RBG_16_64_12]
MFAANVGICLLATGGWAWGAEQQPPDQRPNVLLLVSDDQRPDTIRALGNPIIHTPHLDSLVREGTAFTRAIAPNPICVPSRAEIMTGCDGFRNHVGVSSNRMNPELMRWADCMRQAGYHAWYVGKWMNDGRPTTQGYEESDGLFAEGGAPWWVDQVDYHGRPVTGYRGWVFQGDKGIKFPEKGVGLTPGIDKEFADAAIRFIRRKWETPFFLHVNFTAPHDPLLMPPGYEGKYDPEKIPLPPNFLPRHAFDHGNFEGRDEKLLPWPRTPKDVREDLAVYYAVISYMDEQLGRILAALEATGQADNTIVIFTSDQGLAMGSHGLRGKQNMYEHTVGAPLIFRGPGIPKGQRRDAQCYLRDLYPTVCDLAGIEIPATVQGRRLGPVLRGEVDSIYPAVFGHFADAQRMIRTDRWKLIHYPKVEKYQLFDLANDPYELENLAVGPCRATVFAELRAKLEAWQKEVGDPLVTE